MYLFRISYKVQCFHTLDNGQYWYDAALSLDLSSLTYFSYLFLDKRGKATGPSLHHFRGLWRSDSCPLFDDPWSRLFHNKVCLKRFLSQNNEDIFRLGKDVKNKTSKQQSHQNPVSISRERRWSKVCALEWIFHYYHLRPENNPPNFNVPPPNSYNAGAEEPRRKPMEDIALEPVHHQRSVANVPLSASRQTMTFQRWIWRQLSLTWRTWWRLPIPRRGQER